MPIAIHQGVGACTGMERVTMVKRQNGWNLTTGIVCFAVMVVAVTFAAPLASADTYTLIMSPTSCGDNKAPCDSYTFTTTVATTAQANVFNVTFDVKDTGKIVNNQLVYDNSIFTNFGLTLFTGSA